MTDAQKVPLSLVELREVCRIALERGTEAVAIRLVLQWAEAAVQEVEDCQARERKLLEALEPFAERGRDLDHLLCHVDLVPTAECIRCGPVMRARAAIEDTAS